MEEKVSQVLTQKEEQNIKLKSDIVILKNKLARQKLKMKEAVETGETAKIKEMRQQLEDGINLKNLEIEQHTRQLEAKNENMSALET